MKLYSNEIVFRGHPDKVCDQISDAILDAYLEKDPFTRAGIETVGGKGKIFITGEVTSTAEVDIEPVVKETLKSIGYDTSYEIINNIGKQSPDIAQGVDVGGAGDQGMMFGYACNETPMYIPKAMAILQELSIAYDFLCYLSRDTKKYLPDGKAQITGYYDEDFRLKGIKTFTISYQNSEENRKDTDATIKKLAENICKRYKVKVDEFLINPTGKFLIGGFEGDSGLTGRKIVVDTYQSFAPAGGGAFSGKDPTKVDRSGAYKARQLAIQTLRKYKLDWCEIQLSYAIGIAEPLAIYIDSNLGNLSVPENWYEECKPENIIKQFKLRRPIYTETAMFGHFGNDFSWDQFM